MSEALKFEATERKELGKGSARALRRENRIPAVIYGGKDAPVHISLPGKEIKLASVKKAFKSTVLEISVDGKSVKTLARDIQLNPVTDVPEHVDLQRLEANAKMRIQIPVSFANRSQSPGLKRGGIMNIVRREIEFLCDPNKVPSQIEVDLTGLEIGDSLHIESIDLPEGLEPTLKWNFTIATIVGKSAKTEEEELAEEAAAAAEGEEGEEGEAKAEGEEKAEGDKQEKKEE